MDIRVAGAKRGKFLTSDWLREWCDILKPIKEGDKAKVQANHDTQLKAGKWERRIESRSWSSLPSLAFNAIIV